MNEESDAQNAQKGSSESANPNPYTDPAAVASYAQNPPRVVPGFVDLQRMTALLIAERAPANARVLVLGAGGGLELKVFAEANPGWQFDGVDPAAEMLELARATLGPLMKQVQLHQGYIETAPEGPFDAATCLLTMHFLTPEERRRTLVDVRRRLKPGAPFVVAHLSFPQNEPERALWLSRYAGFATTSGIDSDKAQKASAAISARLPLLSPEHDEAMLYDTGFSGVSLFYAGFCFRGWVAYG
ncbi:class I SAM-dependent methyltransferase [Spirosoma endbachense]|uniref:Methyltransferase domain-containing protein n=1 Tax=Spirosoma endbachense TaxID=2666025 RepID=A0A6P1VRL5_9BACT|nr:class I SAM-dependent methyltransferase [Spirosoma endbachense]QHV95723.1 methyltransferase domain-containing protein [Spirosoma endbachense]